MFTLSIIYTKKLIPREWQKSARKAYIESIESDDTKFTTVAPCGSGKTFHGHRVINIRKNNLLLYVCFFRSYVFWNQNFLIV